MAELDGNYGHKEREDRDKFRRGERYMFDLNINMTEHAFTQSGIARGMKKCLSGQCDHTSIIMTLMTAS